MNADCFLDTNILVYAVDTTRANAYKQSISQELLAISDFGLSAQVLQEFYVIVTRKITSPLQPDEALKFMDRFNLFPTIPTDYSIITEGIRNSIKFRISYWDGAIIAAAERLKCKTLYSEDLNPGQQYGSVEVINPFL